MTRYCLSFFENRTPKMSSAKSRKDNDFETNHPEEFQKLIAEFRDTMKSKCKPLPDDPDYFTNEKM